MGHHRRKYRKQGCSEHRRNGVIYRVTKTVGEKLDLKRKWVLFGFIALCILNFPLAAFLFLLAWFWTDHPGKLENWWGNAKANFNPSFATANASPDASPQGSASETTFEADPFFEDLKKQFDDLETRTGKMEEQVTSEEFNLRQEFKKMED
ncbi:MAG: hypothetical protein OQJ97_09520 [Rhodospirillales bacterium]|nr:hypothetical protein [Rhodospirillales bacterium]